MDIWSCQEKTFSVNKNIFLFVLVVAPHIITTWRHTYLFIYHYIIAGHIPRDPGPPEPRAHHCLPHPTLISSRIHTGQGRWTGATAGSRGTREHDRLVGQTHARCAHGTVWVQHISETLLRRNKTELCQRRKSEKVLSHTKKWRKALMLPSFYLHKSYIQDPLVIAGPKNY